MTIATVLGVVFKVLVLIVLAWAIIFGGIGALLARQRGGSWALGLGWGILLGPIGWIVIWFTTRGRSAADLEPASYTPATSTLSEDTPDGFI